MGLTGLLFTAGFMGLLAMSFARSPMYGLYAYLAAFYVHPPSRWWGAGLPDLRWSLLASVVLLISINSHRKRGEKTDFFTRFPVKLLIVFCAWVWVQTAWAMDIDEHLTLAVLFTKYIVLLYVLYEVLRTREDLRNFMFVNVMGCGYLSYLAWQAGGGGRLEGVGGPGINEANALGMQIAVGMMFASMLLLVMRHKLWFLVLLPLPLMANAVVQTVSRSAFLALLMGGAALWYLRPPGYGKLFYTFAGLAVAGFLAVAGHSYWERISTVTAAVNAPEEVDKSAQSRVVTALAQWEMFKLYPMGTGHRGTVVLSPLFIDETYLTVNSDGSAGARASHNTFLTLLVEQGVPGALMFFVAVAWTVLVVRRLRTLDRHGGSPWLGAARAAAAAGLVVVLIGGIFVDYLKVEVQLWCLAMLLSLVRIAEQEYGWVPARRATALPGVSPAPGTVAAGAPEVAPKKRRRRHRIIGERPVGSAPHGTPIDLESGH